MYILNACIFHSIIRFKIASKKKKFFSLLDVVWLWSVYYFMQLAMMVLSLSLFFSFCLSHSHITNQICQPSDRCFESFSRLYFVFRFLLCIHACCGGGGVRSRRAWTCTEYTVCFVCRPSFMCGGGRLGRTVK